MVVLNRSAWIFRAATVFCEYLMQLWVFDARFRGSHRLASEDVELKDHTDVAVIELFWGQQGKKITRARRAPLA